MRILKRDGIHGQALWKEFYLNILSKLWCSSKFFSNNCVDMDSIPWEKAKLYEFGKKSRLSQMSKRELAHILPWRRDFTERKPHYVLEKKPSGHFDHADDKEKKILNRGYSLIIFSRLSARLSKQASKASFQPRKSILSEWEYPLGKKPNSLSLGKNLD